MFKGKKLLGHALVFGGMCLLLWTWGYFSLLKSESYEFSVKFIENNPTVVSKLGEIKSSRPGFVNFKQSYSDGVWRDRYNVVVNGSRDSGTVHVNIESRPEGWKVNSAILETKTEQIQLVEKKPN